MFTRGYPTKMLTQRPRCIEHQHRGPLRIRGHHLWIGDISAIDRDRRMKDPPLISKKKAVLRPILGFFEINMIEKHTDMKYMKYYFGIFVMYQMYQLSMTILGFPPCCWDPGVSLVCFLHRLRQPNQGETPVYCRST